MPLAAPLTVPKRNVVRMAWASDAVTGAPRYIAEVANGAACGCVCPSCGSRLLAVNARKQAFLRSPHFRHVAGTETDGCRRAASRAAFHRGVEREGKFVLPGSLIHGRYVTPGGRAFVHFMQVPEQQFDVADIWIEDEATAIFVCRDGRRLNVHLKGVVRVGGGSPAQRANFVEIDLAHPEFAGLNESEVRERLVLSGAAVTGCTAWEEARIRADELAREEALAAFELDEDFDGPAEWSRESALHKAVKRILAEAGYMTVPSASVRCSPPKTSHLDDLVWSTPEKTVRFESVEAESRLGRVIPDIVATARARDGRRRQLLIEVVVTHDIDDGKYEALKQLGVAVLKLDFRQIGGLVDETRLRALVLDDLSLKTWVYHPIAESERAKLQSELDAKVEAERVESHAWNQQFAQTRHVPVAPNVATKGGAVRRGGWARPGYGASASESVWLQGRELARWKRDHPEAWEDWQKSRHSEAESGEDRCDD